MGPCVAPDTPEPSHQWYFL